MMLQRILLMAGPILAALVIAGAILAAAGVDPLAYYGYVVQKGLFSAVGLQQTLTRMAPLLFIAAGLIIAFRAGIWNLGTDGQFLLGAVTAAASAPWLVTFLPVSLAVIVSFLLSAGVAVLWSLLPALLRAYQGVNEIITTLMMTFLGTSLANVLVKLVFLDPKTTVPQTRTLPVEDRLPRMFGTTVSSGLILGIIAVIAVHIMMTRTSFGLRLRMVGRARGLPSMPGWAFRRSRSRSSRCRRGSQGWRVRSTSSASMEMSGPTGTRPMAWR